MLGGNVIIAMIRVAGVILLFSQMSQFRFDRKKTVIGYALFTVVLVSGACVWYVLDFQGCARAVAFIMYMFFSIFSIFMSSEPVYLSVYKLALTFYLLSVFLTGGLEVSILFFHSNVWVDIIVRIMLILLMAYFIEKKVKSSIRGFSDYVESELDRFSITIMVMSILFGIGFILNPRRMDQTPYRLFQAAMNLFLTGSLQLLVFRLYLHVGKEKEYQKENQLMKLNHRLMERQVELLEESVESGRRIRHDVRHHNAVIGEYARRGQTEELLQYLKEYQKKSANKKSSRNL